MISAAKEKILQKKLENLFFKIMEISPVLAKKTGKKGKPDIFLLDDAEMRRIKKKISAPGKRAGERAFLRGAGGLAAPREGRP